MEYSDIIAHVYARQHVAGKALDSFAASPCYIPPRVKNRQSQCNRRETESTQPPEDEGSSALDYLSCLEIRFSDIPRTDRGLIFRSNKRCDVVLDSRVVSNSHFSLTFDEERRVVVQDLGSFLGTEVTYDGEGEGMRSHFRWVVGGHSILNRVDSILINLQGDISFQIVVPDHDVSSRTYTHKVNMFCQGAATAEGLLDDLGLSNPRTRVATGAHTPGTGEIHLRRKLGEGAFGIVTHLWNVSTGSEHVVKEPTAKAVRRRQVNRSAWAREARIMSQVSHPHIVELLTWSLDPYPQLHLEYIPWGALEDHEDITYNETLTILQQCLSALVYLHGNDAPIAHRDIKPSNILVMHRFEGDIHVKLGDFGLSRDSSELMTFCGTPMYLAPEIYSERERSVGDERLGYTAAVDIWSLGVVACELAYDLPRYHDRYRDNGVEWCKKIVKRLQSSVRRRPSGLKHFLSSSMLILAQEARFSASECYHGAARLVRAETCGFEASSSNSHLEGDEDEALTDGTKDAVTVLWQPRSWTVGDSTISSRLIRSDAPAPETASSPRIGQDWVGASQASKAVPSSAIRQYINWGDEYCHFAQNYSSNQFDPLYVGSCLAAELGGEEPGSGTSQAQHGSSQRVQAAAVRTEHGPGSTLARWAGPRGEDYLENEDPSLEGGDPAGAEEYLEMEQAALLLQAIAQDQETR